MKSINDVTLLGHTGHKPELTNTKGGPVCRFSLATNEVFMKGDKQEERTTWHSIIAWKSLAEVCAKSLDKGSRVLVRGRLQSRDYEYQGEKRTRIEIVAGQIIFLDPKKESAGSGADEVVNDGVPF